MTMVEQLVRACVAAVTGWGSLRDERGDVPGWVLITVMTAGLVTALWAVAGEALNQMLTEALGSVSR